MAVFNQVGLQTGGDTEARLRALEDYVYKLERQLEFVMNNLDSKNVKKINTNITQVRSDKGETFIDGALLIMKDETNTTRASLGYDQANKQFIFTMYDNAGNQTIYFDSDGIARLKELNTDITNVSSQNGETVINGPLIEMYDNSENLRLKMGYNGTSFTFEMYDVSENKTVELDGTTGKLVVVDGIFKGTIETTADAIIGNNIALGVLTADDVEKAIEFNNSAVIRTAEDPGNSNKYTRLEVLATSFKPPQLISQNDNPGLTGTITLASYTSLEFENGLLVGAT